MLCGIELNTKILNVPIEILGYGIDYNKMATLLNNIYIDATQRNLIEANRLYDKCIKYGIKLDDNCLFQYNTNEFASGFFHNQIIKYALHKVIGDNYDK